MRLAFHHFRKEARHLLPRWWPWLALLALELLINLGWIWENQDSLAYIAPFVTWGLAFWLTTSFCPADHPASINRFTATRPLPPVSFHLARVITFAVMVVLPLMLQEGCFLILSHRPWSEVLTAMLERGILVVALMGWWLPFSTMASGKDSFFLLLAAIIGLVLPTTALEALMLVIASRPEWYKVIMPHVMSSPADTQGWVFLGLAGAAALAVLAILSHRWAWTAPRQRAAFAALMTVLFFTGLYWPFPRLSQRSTAPDMVARLESQKPEFTTAANLVRGQGVNNNLYIATRLKTAPPAEGVWSVQTRINHGSLQLGSQTLATPTDRFPTPMDWPRCTPATTLAPLFPEGTLFRYPETSPYQDSTPFIPEVPADWELTSTSLPLQLRADVTGYVAHWERMADLPLKEGASVSLPGATWRVAGLYPGHSSVSGQEQFAITTALRLERAAPLLTEGPWHWSSTWIPVLYLPEKNLVWLECRQTEDRQKLGHTSLWMSSQRGTMSRWQSGEIQMSWHGVLDAPGGVASKDLGKLRLVILRRDFVGKAHWQVEVPNLKVADQAPAATNLRPVLPRNQVADWLQSLPPLPANATADDARGRWADLLQRASISEGETASEWANSVHVRSLVRQFPEILFNTRTGMDLMQGKEINRALATAFEDSQQGQVVDHLIDRPWLVGVVLARGWESAARRVAAPLIRSSQGQSVDTLAMRWKAAEDVPALIERATKGRPNPQLYEYLRQFPAGQESLRAALARKMSGHQPVVDIYLSQFENKDWQLPLALGEGVPRALAVTLHLAQVLTADERSLPQVREFIGQLPPLIQLIGTDDKPTTASDREARQRFDQLAALQPDNFRYDAALHRWIQTPAP